MNNLKNYIAEIIRKCRSGDSKKGKSVCLYTKDGSKLLGRHKNKKSAKKQEAAIEIRKHS